MFCTIWTPVFQLSRGLRNPLLFAPKDWIKLGDSRWTLPVAETVGNATARVWITSPRDASKSARAFTNVLFCFNVRFSASTIDSGCVIHPAKFVENGVAIATGAFDETGKGE